MVCGCYPQQGSLTPYHLLILCTCSGKSTQVPQYLAEALLSSRQSGNIICTQVWVAKSLRPSMQYPNIEPLATANLCHFHRTKSIAGNGRQERLSRLQRLTCGIPNPTGESNIRVEYPPILHHCKKVSPR